MKCDEKVKAGVAAEMDALLPRTAWLNAPTFELMPPRELGIDEISAHSPAKSAGPHDAW
jgi:hypothetical protein